MEINCRDRSVNLSASFGFFERGLTLAALTLTLKKGVEKRC